MDATLSGLKYNDVPRNLSDSDRKGADVRLGEKEKICKCQQLNIIHTSLIFL